VQDRADETVLWVAHGGSLRVLLCLALELDDRAFWRFPLRNLALSELEVFDRGAVLNYLNDTAHLTTECSQPSTQQNGRSRCTLVLGGARSGKSTFAQTLAERCGGERVLYVATAEPGDEEMQLRIARHRAERAPHWETLETRRSVAQAIARQPGEFDVVLIDCLTLLVANVLGEIDDPFSPEAETAVVAEIEELLAWADSTSARLLLVSNEVGLGLVPPYPLGRAYRDLLGRANQMVASGADEVYLLVAGLPLQLKGAHGLTAPLASILGG
jgi:adenosylcobinamide kinase/adenosylcobinamide-phosphate guanylyltransferase